MRPYLLPRKGRVQRHTLGPRLRAARGSGRSPDPGGEADGAKAHREVTRWAEGQSPSAGGRNGATAIPRGARQQFHGSRQPSGSPWARAVPRPPEIRGRCALGPAVASRVGPGRPPVPAVAETGGTAEAEPARAGRAWLEDQHWTLNRVKTVMGRRFHLTCTIQGVRKLLVRYGWSARAKPASP
ncbi:hypothetical protein CP967_29280 [Streptomyces nitrosporeus]|uniref:Winged helix-turn helix domain-containing protein n=1 Tax=Streptomyces nitrosporeus TaxID=28894 RepID=A0A5J6FGL2_9ACTN|nr:hypothetical protein CP967_29280 [Streptomyces nitrosporeus]